MFVKGEDFGPCAGLMTFATRGQLDCAGMAGWRLPRCSVAKLHPAEGRSFGVRTGAAAGALMEGKVYEENRRE